MIARRVATVEKNSVVAHATSWVDFLSFPAWKRRAKLSSKLRCDDLRLGLTSYCLLLSPVASAEIGLLRESNACWPAALLSDRCQPQFRPPAACHTTARECNLRPSPSPLHRRVRAAAPDL